MGERLRITTKTDHQNLPQVAETLQAEHEAHPNGPQDPMRLFVNGLVDEIASEHQRKTNFAVRTPKTKTPAPTPNPAIIQEAQAQQEVLEGVGTKPSQYSRDLQHPWLRKDGKKK